MSVRQPLASRALGAQSSRVFLNNTSDYASPGFAGLRYMAHWRFWHFSPFWLLFANLPFLATFWQFFWLILILGQFAITPFSDIF